MSVTGRAIRILYSLLGKNVDVAWCDPSESFIAQINGLLKERGADQHV